VAENPHQQELAPQAADYVAIAVRSILGATPFAGSLLVEIAGVVIPNQRMDRIAKFAAQLEARLDRLEQDLVVSQLHDEHFTDLMEEALRQASRSLSDDRRAQIAHLLVSSLGSDDITYLDSKHLLRIAGDLNDIEIIRLGRYVFDVTGTGEDYWEKHASVLQPVGAYLGSSQGEIDRETLQESYDEHLEQLGLVADGELTRLGRLLCRELGVPENGPA
jgi:outer membrane murein-binding lipoprotein Lpp